MLTVLLLLLMMMMMMTPMRTHAHTQAWVNE
jgi:hypothetical protein